MAANLPSNVPGKTPTLRERIERGILGAPRDVTDRQVFHRMSLIAFLAWVGLGADGLSSSAYGPEEAFRVLGEHTYLAVALAIATAATVMILSASYRNIIEEFPGGGGGYVVASRFLGPRAGVVSGCALIVDYVLTITVSIAGGGNAIFSFLSPSLHRWKLPAEYAAIALLIVLNLRGVKESVKVLLPIFLVFLATHALLIGTAFFQHLDSVPQVVAGVSHGFSHGLTTLGATGMLLLFLRAYSLGGGTFTGIEAVSNGLQIMREPRAETGKRTMNYMAVSLAVTASGILIGYLLLRTHPMAGKTMNALLAEAVFGGWRAAGVSLGYWLVLATLVSEGMLLFVAAQAGFIDGPRVMANMAVDSFFPHRFAALSERLTMQNGVLLMGGAALLMLFYTAGNIHTLIVMYSINVFLTFTLSQLSMTRFFLGRRERGRRRNLGLHLVALVMCATILAITVYEKFSEGGWLTVVITTVVVGLCIAIKAHYDRVRSGLRKLDEILGSLAPRGQPNEGPLERNLPTAVLLVNGFNGLGIHTLLSTLRYFPGLYKQFVFVSVSVVDSGTFKGKEEVDALQRQTDEDLAKYVRVARSLGFPAEALTDVGTEVLDAATDLCTQVSKRFPKATIITGRLVFRREAWFDRLLHNETPKLIQQRLQWLGVPMVILPVRVQV
jgi:amino acid transporter